MEALHTVHATSPVLRKAMLWIKKNVGDDYAQCVEEHFVTADGYAVAAKISHTPLTSLLCEKALDYLARERADDSRAPVVTNDYAKDAIAIIRQVPLETHQESMATVLQAAYSQMYMECSDIDANATGSDEECTAAFSPDVYKHVMQTSTLSA